MKKFVVLLLSLITFSICNTVFAAPRIICDATIDGEIVNISGQILESTARSEVTILVGTFENILDIEKVLYINQTHTDNDGRFEFIFPMPEDTGYGTYNIAIGSNSGAKTYKDIINYKEELPKVTNKYIDIDLDASINSYVPKIEGSITCSAGKTIVVEIKNITDQVDIANDIFNGGVHEVSYQLPSILSGKEYTVSVSCFQGKYKLSQLYTTIDSSITSVSVDGFCNLADETNIECTIETNDINLIDKSISIKEDQEFSGSLPNILPNLSINLTMMGYETVLAPIEIYRCNITGRAFETFEMMAVVNNVETFDNKLYTISYDSEQVEVLSFFEDEENCINVGTFGDVEIIFFEPGEIKFRPVNIQVPQGQLWSGLLNTFKFKFASDYSGNTEILFSE